MYLNNTNNQFYKDAIEHIKKCENDFWDLDDHLEIHLLEINKNTSIKTLYSRKGDSRKGFGKMSYIRFCYTQELESKIENILTPSLKKKLERKYKERFKENFEDSGISFSYKKIEPKIGTSNPNEKNICLKYISNPQYWNIWNFYIELDDGIELIHNDFWELITLELGNIK